MPSTTSVKSPTKHSNDSRRAMAQALLSQALGFRDCRTDTLVALIEAGIWRTLSKGEVLAQRGLPFDMLCLIVEGSIEASLIRHDGHRHLVSFLQPGDVAGMISLLDGLGHVNDLCARSKDTLILLVPGAAIRQLREQDASLSSAFERQLAFRSRMLHERLASDPSMALHLRLARLLQTLAVNYGTKHAEGVQLQMKISQSDLGDWLGVSRQSANLAVQQLRNDGLIRLRYSTITIVDPGKLAELAKL